MAEIRDVIAKAPESVPTAGASWRGALFGLAAALCWSISPIFIRHGLEGLSSPLLGVTVGMLACTVAYGLALLIRRGQSRGIPIPRDALIFQLVAGVLVALATWARWIALDLAPVGVVLALGRLSVPVVMLLAPLLVGQHLERVTARLWLGAALIVGGSLLMIIYR